MLTIEAHRRRHGWSQRKLAELVGCHYSTVSYWESGKQAPSGIRGRRVAELFGVPLAELLRPQNDDDRAVADAVAK